MWRKKRWHARWVGPPLTLISSIMFISFCFVGEFDFFSGMFTSLAQEAHIIWDILFWYFIIRSHMFIFFGESHVHLGELQTDHQQLLTHPRFLGSSVLFQPRIFFQPRKLWSVDKCVYMCVPVCCQRTNSIITSVTLCIDINAFAFPLANFTNNGPATHSQLLYMDHPT